MKVSLKWLRDYVPIKLSVPELSHQLSMAGDEVEGIERIGGDWQEIRVAEVAKIEKHPNADRLVLATVELGGGKQTTIVTGAPNLEAGQKVPYAPVGTRLIDGHTGQMMTLKPAKIRGIESAGMVCSAMELGLGDDHTGILVLSPDVPIGALLADVLGDVVFDLKTTPNRPDTLSMLGVAWEVSAITGEPVSAPNLDYPATEPSISGQFRVQIEDPQLCNRYMASLIKGVTIGPSPLWMQERLQAAGMRPINNVVDITNYVMLEYGQPLHAFDAAKIAENTIIVRPARQGEHLVTLDGQDHELDPSMLVIADAGRPIALAGVMGGLDSEVTGQTTDILLESANFHNITLRRTAQALRMRSEASLRFEKGLSADMTEPALRRATQLLVELAGGQAARDVLDEYPIRRQAKLLTLSEADVERVLGVRWQRDRLRGVFVALGFAVENVDEASIRVTPPPWRVDANLTEDLVEEVARIIGYEELPATALRGAISPMPPDPLMQAGTRVRDVLVAAGMQEIISYPLVSRDLLAKAGAAPEPLALVNPMTVDQSVMRTSIRPGLLKTLADNIRRTDDGVALFEVGAIYLPREDDLPEERQLVAGVLSGPRGTGSWFGTGEPMDFYDGKGVVEAISAWMRTPLTFVRGSDPFFHHGRCATLLVNGKDIGVLGEVHPEVARRFDLEGRVVYFEVTLAALVRAETPIYEPVTRFPEVVQDVAFIVDEALEADKVRIVLRSGKFVRDVRLFDVYRGAPLPEGKKSLAFTLRFQAPDRTLTEVEISKIRNGLVDRLGRQYGAELRG